MLADLPHSVLPNSLARTVAVKTWAAPYLLTMAAREHELTHRAQAEVHYLRTQQRSRRTRPDAHGVPHAARLEMS